MNRELFMLNGAVAMVVPAAEAGSTATMDTKPETQVKENEPKTNNEAATGNMSGSSENTASSTTSETSGVAGGEATGGETAGADGSENETTANDTDMSGGDTADMMGGDTANMAGDAMNGMNGMDGMNAMNTEMGTSKPITQNAPVMIGITAGVLALSILVGIGLAKLKIKKGINLYED